MKKCRIVISLLTALVLVISCLSVFSSAAALTIVKQPTNRSLYQGIDWAYSNDNELSIIHQPDLTGTVLSNGSKQVTYAVNKLPNMFAKKTGTWVEGENTVTITCTELSGTATTTVKLVPIKSISIVTPPDKTVFVKGIDWQPGPFDDVEFTYCDLKGLTIKATYTDGVSKTVKADNNKLIGWSVGDVRVVYPGDTILYATFCGKTATFPITFATTNPYKLGDVSMDGDINSYDALLILQSATGSITLNADKSKLADVSKDGSINSYDALLVLQYSVGVISSF